MELGELVGLQFLYLSKNLLTSSVPESLGKLRLLQQVGLDFNGLNGTIPATFSNLSLLQAIYFQGNAFEGGIDWISELSLLQYAFLSTNRFSGTIPEGVARNPTLQQLGVDSNGFSGTIPYGFGVYQNVMQAIYLQNNNLSGTLYSELCSIPACYASNNEIECPLPANPCCAVTC